MRLFSAYSGQAALLILDTAKAPPEPRQRGLLLCRSLTIEFDRLLAGPLGPGAWPEFQCMDPEGLPIPADAADAAAFAAFLPAAGYPAPAAVRWENRLFFPDRAAAGRWTVLPGPEGTALRQLLAI